MITTVFPWLENNKTYIVTDGTVTDDSSHHGFDGDFRQGLLSKFAVVRVRFLSLKTNARTHWGNWHNISSAQRGWWYLKKTTGSIGRRIAEFASFNEFLKNLLMHRKFFALVHPLPLCHFSKRIFVRMYHMCMGANARYKTGHYHKQPSSRWKDLSMRQSFSTQATKSKRHSMHSCTQNLSSNLRTFRYPPTPPFPDHAHTNVCTQLDMKMRDKNMAAYNATLAVRIDCRIRFDQRTLKRTYWIQWGWGFESESLSEYITREAERLASRLITCRKELKISWIVSTLASTTVRDSESAYQMRSWSVNQE